MACIQITGHSASKEYKSALIDIQKMGNILGQIKDISIELVPAVLDCSKRFSYVSFG